MNFLSRFSSETKALTLLVVVIAGSALYWWYKEPTSLPTKQFVSVPPIAAVKSVPVDTLVGKKVQVLRKSEVGKKIHLPDDVASDPSKEVTATADVPPSKAGTEIISVYNSETGATTLQAKAKELPLFGLENEKRIGVGYSITSRGKREIGVFGEYTFVRVGGVYGSVRAEANSSAEAKATAQIDYRF